MPTFDENISRALRMGNIFSPTASTPPLVDPTTAEGSMSFDPLEGSPMASMEQPEVRADELLPQYEGPGMLTRIAASLIGLSDPQTSMAIMQEPYNRWLDEQNRMTSAAQAGVQAGTQADKAALDWARHNLNVAEHELAAKKFEEPHLELIKPDVGNYRWYDPRTGDIEDTGWDRGSLSPQAEADLRVETEERILGAREESAQTRAQTSADIQRETTKQSQERSARLQRETTKIGQERGARIAQEREARQAEPGSKVETATAIKKRAQDIMNRDPSKGKWLEFTAGGVRVRESEELVEEEEDRPINLPFGRTRAELDAPVIQRLDIERQQIMNELYGSQQDIPEGETGNAKRDTAIQTLEDAGKPVTEANIQYVMGQL